MCRFLLTEKQSPNGAIQEGDLIAVVPDSHVFSVNEEYAKWLAAGNTEVEWDALNINFWIIDVVGMPVSEGRLLVQEYTRAATVLDPEFTASDEADRRVKLGRSRHHLNKGLLPTPIRKSLENNRTLSFDYAQVADFLDKVIDRNPD